MAAQDLKGIKVNGLREKNKFWGENSPLAAN
jgi:hypothetical protein